MTWFERLRRRITGLPVEPSERELPKLPPEGKWLVDVPLYIDDELVGSFHDTIVRPIGSEFAEIPRGRDTTTGDETSRRVSVEAGLSGDKPFGLLDVLPITPSLTTSGEQTTTESESTTTRYELVSTPIRKLVQIIFHYHRQIPDRLSIPSRPGNEDWVDPDTIAERPRQLVMLDLPGKHEADRKEIERTMLIPVAAEFSNERVLTFRSRLGTETEMPPRFPRHDERDYVAKRQAYWSWFTEHYDSRRSVTVIEEAAAENGRIRWIDFRVPLTSTRTLELHFSPSEDYDTGKFAYELVERGFRHGLRLVGILRAGPAMEMMAVYNK